MFDNIAAGLGHMAAEPIAIVIFFAALIGGLVFGAIPGLSGITLAAVLLPVSVHLSSTNAIMMFAVIYSAAVFGGAITAILFNIPGDSNNAPTVFDGYPMTQRGEASLAIGTVIICSALGGAISVVIMMLLIEPIAFWAIRSFGPAEIFSVVVFGLTVSAGVGASSALKGWLSVGLGLLIATVGTSPSAGDPRFTFGSIYLQSGVAFVPLLLGFFAVAEIFNQAHQRVDSAAKQMGRISVELPGLVEFWRQKLVFLRSLVIGFITGLLPGAGATLAAFVSYSETVRWSKHPERFGKGELAGVVAPETANNTATGAAMIPLLAVGIPGGALTAIMLAAFQMHGLQPGPLLLISNSNLVWVVMVAMLLANVAILALGYVQTRYAILLLKVPFPILGAGILVVSIIGAFAIRNSAFDVWVMFVAGAVGYLMRRSGYSTAGLVLGVILGGIGENAFVQAMTTLNYDLFALFQRPIAALLIAAAGLALGHNLYRGWRELRQQPGAVG